MDPGGDQPTGPFEGPEKLLEIWFKPSPAHVPGAAAAADAKFGLRKVPMHIWADMLDIVKCKILSDVQGTEMDAYLLSESSLFVSPHRLILKTCGTTLNLLGVPRILEIAREHAGLPDVYRCFYSRKAFMFPERQAGPHREWRAEIEYLDEMFKGAGGAAYTVGKMNGDHWLLWMAAPGEDGGAGSTRSNTPVERPVDAAGDAEMDIELPQEETFEDDGIAQDYTIEILMTHLSPTACAPFFTNEAEATEEPDEIATPSARAMALSSELGISALFPEHVTTLDAYAFSPCGYSCNALLKWDPDAGADFRTKPSASGEGYYTIHVTPEDGWSYASFECNVPLPTRPEPDVDEAKARNKIPDLRTLIRRVVNIFQPGRITLTLFVSSEENNNAEEEDGESAVEAGQRAFKAALTRPCPRVGAVQSNGAVNGNGVAYKNGVANGHGGATNGNGVANGHANGNGVSGDGVANGHTNGHANGYANRNGNGANGSGGGSFSGIYKRTDKINYEFGGYDLAFATFELRQ